MSFFQLVVTAIFVAFIVIGVGVFALFGGLGGSAGVGAVTVWGTFPAEAMDNAILTLRSEDKAFQNVVYEEKSPETYQSELVSAMAAGVGPDLFLISHEDISTFADKVLTIPYGEVSRGEFVNSYVDAGQIFLTPQGSLALPFLIDPLVMYWNRDLFASAGVAQTPRYWNDFLSLAPKITSLDESSLVRRSAVALGEWRNIKNAKAILSTLLIQAGDVIVARGEDGSLQSVLGSTPSAAAENPAQSALRFYTEFANPSKAVYSWNRSLPEAQDAFVAGNVAVYFGFASEVAAIAGRNPNLAFGVEVVPQIQANGARLTFGRVTGLAISRSAKNPQGALIVAKRLTGQSIVAYLTKEVLLPPVRRDVSLDTSASASASVFAQSALIARGWLDPSTTQSNSIFQTMIESVASGRSSPAEAISDGARTLEQLLRSQR